MTEFPDRTVIAQVRVQIEDALAENRALTVTNQEQIAALLKMADKIISLSTDDDPFKLELLESLRSGSRRALRAQGIDNLYALAEADPEDLRVYCEEEGVVPRGYEEWPWQAQQLIAEIEAGMGMSHEPPVVQVNESRSMLTRIKGIGDQTAQALNEAGIFTLADMAQADIEFVRAYLKDGGITPSGLDQWPERARELMRE